MATSILGQTAVRAAKLEVVTELPEIGKKNQIYLVPNKSSVSGDVYDEYIWINDTWEFLGNKRLELTIDSILKPDSTNPIENKAIYSRFLGVDKDIEVNKNNISVLTGRVNEVDGIAKGAEALAKVNEKRINVVSTTATAADKIARGNESKIIVVQATANTALKNSKENQDSVRNAQITANEAKALVEGLTATTKTIESNVSQLQEFNVVYPNNIRNLTTESTEAEVKEAFIPAIGGSAGVVNTPHVGYLIKGAAYEDSSEDDPEYGPDSTIISVDIIKTDNKDYHKFIYVDNNTAIISVTVDLVNYRLIDKSTLANIEANFKVGTLRDLYISAGAKYNETTGFYELNGLTDITEEQMRVIYEKTWGWWLHLPSLNGFGSALPRTNIPCPDYKIIAYASNISIHSIFAVSGNADNLEVVNLRALYTPTDFDEIKIVDFNWAFQGDKKIREVQGIINVKEARSGLSIGGNIETINIKGLKVSIRFYGSQRLSKESVLYMINNSEATTAITIGLQQAVYDVMKDDADIIAALAEKTNITLIQNT